MTGAVLVLNAGSSSIKFALFDGTGTDVPGSGDPAEVCRGRVEGLGEQPRFRAQDECGTPVEARDLAPGEASSHAAALDVILEFLARRHADARIAVVGHRVVHGGAAHSRSVIVDTAMRAELALLEPLAPLHQPHNLAGIDAARAAFPDAPQVACFDTAFHRTHPWVNDTFALPRALYDEGIRRYGFHGLSYDYISSRLRQTHPTLASGRVVVAHLGNGASMCAIKDGRSVGSSMGFTALDGLPMGTRCGQLDPGVLLYLMSAKGMDAPALTDLLYNRSGLKGLSGISADMRVLEASEEPHAAQAIDYFVYRVRREIGAMAATVAGIDALVFTGGIGENSALIRARICENMDWLGLSVDAARNAANEADISAPGSRCRVLVIRTNEEVVIARHSLHVAGVSSAAT
ncbi:acetate/propionate family kinase [Breoghania sp. L-A4]|uniref:acetate/propionate family kinase n=1 Tax=Breoghania sp. L-A4 TaxID=2304600 RepID=UPI000E3607BE|nr:acetate/propionate family kinase [Breoghania sp. L-A4]AXS38895.1 acetate/propionate family kinase [Breoghania sp. L-A4]